MKQSDLIIIGVVLLGAIGIGYFLLKYMKETKAEPLPASGNPAQNGTIIPSNAVSTPYISESSGNLVVDVDCKSVGRPGAKKCSQYI